jgi:hypothetical protein
MWLINLLERGRALAERIPYSLVARFAVASVFWRSGQTKVEGFFMIKGNTFYLFREEYKVPLLGMHLEEAEAMIGGKHLLGVIRLESDADACRRDRDVFGKNLRGHVSPFAGRREAKAAASRSGSRFATFAPSPLTHEIPLSNFC